MKRTRRMSAALLVDFMYRYTLSAPDIAAELNVPYKTIEGWLARDDMPVWMETALLGVKYKFDEGARHLFRISIEDKNKLSMETFRTLTRSMQVKPQRLLKPSSGRTDYIVALPDATAELFRDQIVLGNVGTIKEL